MSTPRQAATWWGVATGSGDAGHRRGLPPRAVRALFAHLHRSITDESDWFDAIHDMPTPPPQPLLSAVACSDPGLCPSPLWATVTRVVGDQPTPEAVGLLWSACRAAQRLWLLYLGLATVMAAAIAAVSWQAPGLLAALWTPAAAAGWAWWWVPRLRPGATLGALVDEVAAADMCARRAAVRRWVRVRAVVATAGAAAVCAVCAAVIIAVLATQSG